MQSKTFKIDNISCGHCVHTIKTELGELEGVANVDASQETKEVTVNWNDPLTWNEIKDLLIEINYPPSE